MVDQRSLIQPADHQSKSIIRIDYGPRRWLFSEKWSGNFYDLPRAEKHVQVNIFRIINCKECLQHFSNKTIPMMNVYHMGIVLLGNLPQRCDQEWVGARIFHITL